MTIYSKEKCQRRVLNALTIFLLLAVTLTVAFTGVVAATAESTDETVQGTSSEIISEIISEPIPEPTSEPVFEPVPESPFAGGDGTEENPYEIETAEQLNAVRDYLEASFVLKNNIDLKDYTENGGWEPIGTGEIAPFCGFFNGSGHVISNLYIERPDADVVGLFGSTLNAIIVDVILENASVTGHNHVGSLIGAAVTTSSIYPEVPEMIESYIVNCMASGRVFGEEMTGGLVGQIYADGANVTSSVIYCKFSGSVIGCQDVGGIVGSQSVIGSGTGLIEGCSAHGTVNGDKYVGGIAGSNYCEKDGESIITFSYTTANVYGSDEGIGGITGSNYCLGGNTSFIGGCYAAGGVCGFDYVGGIAGTNTDLYGNGSAIISASVALNPFVVGAFEHINRISGEDDKGTFESNYYISSLTCSNYTITDYEDNISGIAVEPSIVKTQKFYEDLDWWEFDVWEMRENEYPYPVLIFDEETPVITTSVTELPDDAGSYILDSDIVVEDGWTTPKGITMIDLNGHNITFTGTGFTDPENEEVFFIKVEPTSALLVTDSSEGETGCITSSDDAPELELGGAVYVCIGTFIFAGGNIVDNKANYGGGVGVSVGTFIQTGGNIVDNYAKCGGGVYAEWSTILQNGGNISHNYASGNVYEYGEGGGIYSYQSTFTLNGGNIIENIADSSGGGIYVNGGDARIISGVIANNDANAGAGICVEEYEEYDESGEDDEHDEYDEYSKCNGFIIRLVMDGGEVVNNNASSMGGGISVRNGAFILNNGTIANNYADIHAGGVSINNGAFTQNGGSIKDNYANFVGGGIDITTTGYYYDDDTYVEGDTSVFTMNGGSIIGNKGGIGGGVSISNSVFELESGSISDNSAIDRGGGIFSTKSTVIIKNGSIINNIGYESGGGICVWGGKAEILSGNIVNNSANVGGGISVEDYSEYDVCEYSERGFNETLIETIDGVLVVNGGNITDNFAKSGGGICAFGGRAEIIDGNIVNNSALSGGGVSVVNDLIPEEEYYDEEGNYLGDGGSYVDLEGELVMSDGNITKNIAKNGGGVSVTNGTFELSGGKVIENTNDNNEASNVYLELGKTITLGEAVATDTIVGVTTEVEPTEDAPVAITGNNNQDYTENFFADNSTYHVENRGNVLYLGYLPPVVPDLPAPTIEANGNVTIPADKAVIDPVDPHKVIIKDDKSGVSLILVFNEAQSSGVISGNVTAGNITAVYDEKGVTFAQGADVAKYNLNITLANATNLLPEIDARINNTVRSDIAASHPELELATMITAVGENVSKINAGNITNDGIEVFFAIPVSWYNKMERIVPFHYTADSGLDTSAKFEVVGNDGIMVKIKVVGSSFSSYGITGVPKSEPVTPTPSSGGGSSGSSTWATVTPTATPTATPTVTPTDTAPTDVPTSGQPTKPAKTPAPFVGLVLGGIVAGVVLRRK